MNSKYLLDNTTFAEGGYAQFYDIIDHPGLGFKEFRNKNKAIYSYRVQKQLSKFDLSPKVHGNLCRLDFITYKDCLSDISGWGYITEKAVVSRDNDDDYPYTLASIQKLVNTIYNKTKLKFWDCHWWNIGLIERKGKTKLVCIDTGKESFDGYVNAWGFANPGPKCCYCLKYQCRCSED
jgi:hypothetical protein